MDGMTEPVQSLYLGGSQKDAAILARHLERAGYPGHLRQVATVDDLTAALGSGTWNLAFADLAICKDNIQAVLRCLEAVQPPVGLILVGENIGRACVTEAILAGAQDVLASDELEDRLAIAVAREIHRRSRYLESHGDRATPREAEQKYRQIFETLDDAIFVADLETHTIIDANKQAEVLAGRSRDEIIGMPMEGLHPPDFIARSGPKFRASVAAGRFDHDLDSQILRKDGRVIPVSCGTTIIDSSGRKIIIGVFRDISRRQQAQQEREAATQLLRLINTARSTEDLIDKAIVFLQDWLKCDAVGIRLRKGEEFPYVQTHGFSMSFVQEEDHLCKIAEAATVVHDAQSLSILEHLCGRVLVGEFDLSQPCFTEHGSFWTNCTSELIHRMNGSGGHRQERGRFVSDGYESVALIPLRLGEEIFGLLQINARQRDHFADTTIALLERLATSLSIALSQRRTEEALRENQRMLATLMSNLPGMAFRCRNDPDWTMEFISDGCLALTGYKPEDLCNSRMIAYGRIIHKDDQQGVWDQIQAALDQKRPYQIVYRIVTAAGAVKWVWEQGRGICAADGTILSIEGFTTDTTQRVETEKALRQSEERYRQLVDLSPDAISIHCDGRIVFVNPACMRLFGATSQDQLLGKRVLDHVHANSQALVAERMQTTRRERVPAPPFEQECLRLDGSTIHVEATAIPLLHNGIPAAQVISRDITDRKRAEEALRQSEERYRKLVELSPDAIYIHQQGRLEFINPAGLKLFGASHPQQVLGKHMLELIHPDYREEVAQRILAIHERRTAVRLLAQKIVRLDGSIVDTEAAATPFERSNQMAVLVIARDISDRRRAEEALLEQTSLRELSHRIIQSQEDERRRLSRELHDEAGQALTAIKLNTELLAKRVPDNLPALKRLAKDTSEVTASLISEMRRIAAALRPAVLEDLGLVPTLRWYAKGIEMRYGLRVKLIHRGLKGRLKQSFETTIYRIVQEALTNVVRHAQAQHAVVKATCCKGGLDLTVQDDGTGMDLGRIRNGTGLTGIRERAHLFGGTMALESRIGEGTTLRVIFRSIPEANS